MWKLSSAESDLGTACIRLKLYVFHSVGTCKVGIITNGTGSMNDMECGSWKCWHATYTVEGGANGESGGCTEDCNTGKGRIEGENIKVSTG